MLNNFPEESSFRCLWVGHKGLACKIYELLLIWLPSPLFATHSTQLDTKWWSPKEIQIFGIFVRNGNLGASKSVRQLWLANLYGIFVVLHSKLDFLARNVSFWIHIIRATAMDRFFQFHFRLKTNCLSPEHVSLRCSLPMFLLTFQHFSWIADIQECLSVTEIKIEITLDLKVSTSCKNLTRSLTRSCKTMHYS